MDTQGISSKEKTNSPLTYPNPPIDSWGPPVHPVHTVFSEVEREELKSIIKEALQEYNTHGF